MNMSSSHKDHPNTTNLGNNTMTLQIVEHKQDIPKHIHSTIARISQSSIETRGCFTLALSGGSVAKFLSNLNHTFHELQINPRYHLWQVCLADERLVPSNHVDSNIRALREEILNHLDIPKEQIHGIEEAFLLLPNASEKIAKAYQQNVMDQILPLSNHRLDCAVLGFGPDGHTCSLFPNHPLLHETEKKVAYLNDSPKPPSSRITLTYPVLNHTRCILFCGAGSSKQKALQGCFDRIVKNQNTTLDDYHVTLKSDSPLPFAMIQPWDSEVKWIVDSEASKGLVILKE